MKLNDRIAWWCWQSWMDNDHEYQGRVAIKPTYFVPINLIKQSLGERQSIQRSVQQRRQTPVHSNLCIQRLHGWLQVGQWDEQSFTILISLPVARIQGVTHLEDHHRYQCHHKHHHSQGCVCCMDPSLMGPLRWSFGTMSTFSAPLVKTNSWYAEMKPLFQFSLFFLSDKICIHLLVKTYVQLIFSLFWEWQMISSIIA